MKNLHLHPDGHIIVRVDEGVYTANLDQFAEDYGELFPSLPPGAAECFYDPDKRHMLADHNNRLMVEYPMPFPWSAGDRILERAGHLLEKQQTRLRLLEDEMKARAEAIAQDMIKLLEKKASKS